MRLQTHNGIALFDSAETQPTRHRLSKPSETSPSIASALTQIATEELSLTAHSQIITVNQWIIFPDGLHALISLPNSAHDGHASSSKPRLLTSFVARFKAATAKRINLVRNQPGAPVWQRSYKEQLVQDEITLARLQKQINGAKNAIAFGSTIGQ